MSIIDFKAIPSPTVELTLRPKKRHLRLGIGGRGHLLKGIKAATILNAVEEGRAKDVVRRWEVGKYRVEVTAFPNPYTGRTKVKCLVSFDYEAPLYDTVGGKRVPAGTMKGVKTIQATVASE